MDTPAILLIEDSPEDARVIVDALSGIIPREQIRLCQDGTEALDFLHCRGAHRNRNPLDTPRLLILDLTLPGVSGLDVLREIRAQPNTRLLPVTVLSASDSPQDIRVCAQLGANSFVRKLADVRQFKETLSQIALYWLQLNIPPPPEARQ